MISQSELGTILREVTRKHCADMALRAALQPHPWFWPFTKEGREERDLQRWADDGGKV